MIRTDELRAAYKASAQLVELLLLKLAVAEIKAGFREDESRGRNGQWIIGDGNYVVSQRETKGNKQIDATTDKIIDVLDKVLSSVGGGSGAWYGTLVHTRAAALLRALDIPGIRQDGIEQSFSFGDLVSYGFSGSIRTDVIQRNEQTGEITAVWDIKTGGATLSPNRVNRIRSHLNIPEDVPVIEVHINLGATIKANALVLNLIVH